MSYLVFVLGLLLAICGAASISFGYGIINVERGWATFIGGAAALSGGVVTIALALILHNLSRLRALLVAERDARAKAAVPPWADSRVATATRTGAAWPVIASARATTIQPLNDDVGAGAVAENPSRDSHPATAAIAQASIEDIRRVVADSIKRKAPEPHAAAFEPQIAKDEQVQDAAPHADLKAPELARRGSFSLPRAIGLKDIAPQHFSAPPTPVNATPSAATEMERGEAAAIATDEARRGTETACAPALRDRPAARSAGARPPQPEAARALPESLAETPKRRGEDKLTVIGRYESDGTSYVMFADGSIDASSERGAFHFSTMAELKAFMDAQARGEA
jgi:hypothetical protein